MVRMWSAEAGLGLDPHTSSSATTIAATSIPGIVNNNGRRILEPRLVIDKANPHSARTIGIAMIGTHSGGGAGKGSVPLPP